MKVGVLSDIHGNSAALRAVVPELERVGVERLFYLGDLVGYYYHPDEALEMLRRWDLTMILGNHERMLAEFLQDPEVAKDLTRRFGSGLRMAVDRLSKEDLQMLLKLPTTLRVEVDGVRCVLAHGSPKNPDLYVYPDSPQAVLNQVAQEDADFVFMGHTHRPFWYEQNGVRVMNVGSVGQPRDFGGYASWAWFDTGTKAFQLEKTLYDVTPVVEEVHKTDPKLNFLADVLRR